METKPRFKKATYMEISYFPFLILKALIMLLAVYDKNETTIISNLIVPVIVCSLISGCWAYQIKRNSIALGAKNVKYSPIKTFLIAACPVLYPFFLNPVFQELWKTSQDPKQWHEKKNSPLITIWATLIILIVILLGFFWLTPESSFYSPKAFLRYGIIPACFLSIIIEILFAVFINRAQYNNACNTENNYPLSEKDEVDSQQKSRFSCLKYTLNEFQIGTTGLTIILFAIVCITLINHDHQYPYTYHYLTFRKYANFFFFIFLQLPIVSWIYCAQENVMKLGARKMFPLELTYFLLLLPVTHVIFSYRILQQIWKASISPTNWQQVKSNKAILIWWVISLLQLVVMVGLPIIEKYIHPIALHKRLLLTFYETSLQINMLFFIGIIHLILHKQNLLLSQLQADYKLQE